MGVMSSFSQWTHFLGEQVHIARAAGMNDATMTQLATAIGAFLAERVDPQNKEQQLLKQLWDVADAEEKKMLARIMMKLVD
jgi:hypothetical protein